MVVKEAYGEKVAALMANTKNIRNIGIVSHIHHGKCVFGDSRIALADGRFVRAEELFNTYSKLGKIVKRTKNEIVFKIDGDKLKVLSLNKKNFKIEEKPIRYIWKLRTNEPLIEIELANGFKITTTPEHKFLTFNGKNVEEIRANSLNDENFVICGRSLHYRSMSLNQIKENILSKLSEDLGFYVWLNKEFADDLKQKIMQKGAQEIWKRIETHFRFRPFYQSCIYRGRYRLKDTIKICKLFKIDITVLYDNIEFLNYRKSLKRFGKASVAMKLPRKLLEMKGLLYLVGLMFGDGCRTFITNENPQIQQTFINICRKLGFRPTIERRKSRSPNILSNGGLTFFNFLKILFNYPGRRKAQNVKISGFLQQLPHELIAEFLKGYFDADGTIEWGRRAISLDAASGQIIKDLQLLLLKFGCVTTIRGNTLYVSGQSAKIFAEKIGFTLEGKKQKMLELVRKTTSSKNTDIIPLDSRLLGPHRSGEVKLSFYSLQKMLGGLERINGSNSEILKLRDILQGDVSFIKIKSISRRKEELVFDFTVADNHNFIAEGVVIHNTCLTDNLAAAAGMIARELVGERMLTWIDEQERERLMTIYGSTVTMVHEYDKETYLINLLDTPGHVDFGSDVTQAMRAVDGGVVLVCAVEGIMPQTETVLRQALAERVKPILFINKVDRAIKELKLGPEALRKRLAAIVVDVNRFIARHVEPRFREQWFCSVEDGSVAFGSALRKWAISIPYMKKSGVTFRDIIELCAADRDEELARRAPLHTVVLDMVIRHLPSPAQAQSYRIERIWTGDPASEIGRRLASCDPAGKLGACVTKVVYDPHAGMICTARIFSGAIARGQDVWMVSLGRVAKVQQVTTFIADKRVALAEVPAGNVVGLVGLPDVTVGETLCEPAAPIEPFEAIKHIFEPVVTKAIEPKSPADLPKLINILKTLSREDPTLRVRVNLETGETLVSGLGELHLDAKVERKIKEKGIPIIASPPIVVYRETVLGRGPEVEGKSPNKHNRFYISVEPVPKTIYRAMIEGAIKDAEIRGKNIELRKKLQDLGLDKETAKGALLIHNHNIFSDVSKGVQYLDETIEMVKDAFKEVTEAGPLAKEPCAAMLVRLHDADLHEDAVHRGPAQIIPAVRYAINQSALKVGTTLLEPKQILRIDTPTEYIGSVTAEVSNRRGEVLNIEQLEYSAIITVKLPVAEMFGFEGALKSATGGKGFQSLMDVVFERMPADLRDQVAARIRERKGLPKELPRAEI
jgi:elongation factor 2